MSSKSKKRIRKSSKRVTSQKTPPVKTEEVSRVKVDLRTAPPVQRLRLVLKNLFAEVESHLVKLCGWGAKNVSAVEPADVLSQICQLADDFDRKMVVFEETGWSPARKSYTAKTDEGDRVAILDDLRSSYSDLMDESLMGDLLVVKKHPGNKSGGLVVEAPGGIRMKVSISHVVKLSSGG